MRTNFTIIFILLFFFSGCNKSTGVVEDEIEYIAEHKLFIENLLELNTELNSDTLDARITKISVIIDETEYYRISIISLKNLGLSNLPESISYLDSLITLDISNNQLSDLPETICSLDVIDGANFLFDDNHLCDASALPPCILEIINFTEQKCDVAYEEDDFQFIQELIVANKIDTNDVNAVNAIYDNVHWTTTENKNVFGQFILRIEKIEWDNKNISTIPHTIGFLDSLNWLELENNIIDTIPGNISQLSKLEYFQAYSNGLKSLPEGLGQLANLKQLLIQDNLLDTLSFDFSKLTSLSEFWVEDNNLTSLPPSLCELITDESLPEAAFQYYGNKICDSANACDLPVNEQDKQDCGN